MDADLRCANLALWPKVHISVYVAYSMAGGGALVR